MKFDHRLGALRRQLPGVLQLDNTQRLIVVSLPVSMIQFPIGRRDFWFGTLDILPEAMCYSRTGSEVPSGDVTFDLKARFQSGCSYRHVVLACARECRASDVTFFLLRQNSTYAVLEVDRKLIFRSLCSARYPVDRYGKHRNVWSTFRRIDCTTINLENMDRRPIDAATKTKAERASSGAGNQSSPVIIPSASKRRDSLGAKEKDQRFSEISRRTPTLPVTTVGFDNLPRELESSRGAV